MSEPFPPEPVASVLVVDDDADIAEAMAIGLGAAGFQVSKASSGAEAVKQAREIRFDVVLCDLRMPGLTGEDTLAGLKAIDPEIEVVMGTGHPTVESAVECMRRGAFDYLTKPYDLAAIERVLRRALDFSRMHGAVELYDASRAVVSTPPAELGKRLPGIARKLLRADASALVIQRGNELEVHLDGAPSQQLVRELAVRGVSTTAPFRFISPHAEGIPTQPGDQAFAAGLVCPLRTAARTEGALVLLRGQDSPPFTLSVVRRAMTFAALTAAAVAAARMERDSTPPGGVRAIPEAAARLLGEARQAVDGLRSAGTTAGQREARLLRLETVLRALEGLLLK